jgi:ligand-binding SRPBCC domain-containing protein
MKIYRLESKQNLPITKQQAWDFLSSPKNLKTITPEYMSFDILSGADRPMFAGQIIQYIVTPVLGIKTKWVTEITHVVEGEYFVHPFIVKPKLNEIFEYRRKKLIELFGEFK